MQVGPNKFTLPDEEEIDIFHGFESLIIKMRDFEPVEYMYFLFVGQRELLGTNLH